MHLHFDNQAMIRICRTGENPSMRYLARTHGINLCSLHERTNAEDCMMHFTESKEMAADSVNELLEEFSSYPKHIKRISRIYILGAKLRKYIHHFLEGLELTTSINLGKFE